MPSDISPELTPGAEMLHMAVIALEARVKALEESGFEKAIELLRRHFGPGVI